jgi:hypothetical protein
MNQVALQTGQLPRHGSLSVMCIRGVLGEVFLVIVDARWLTEGPMWVCHFGWTVRVGGGDSTVGDGETLSSVAYVRYLSIWSVLIDDIVGDVLPGTSVTDLVLSVTGAVLRTGFDSDSGVSLGDTMTTEVRHVLVNSWA